MPTQPPAPHFSEVFHDFLSSATAITAGAPATVDLQRRNKLSTAQITHPGLTIKCEADPDNTDELITLTLTLELEAMIGTEDGQTTREDAFAMMQSLRALLADTDTARAAWNTWIALQNSDYIDGWSIQAIYPQATTDEHDKEKNLLTITAPYQLFAFWNS